MTTQTFERGMCWSVNPATGHHCTGPLSHSSETMCGWGEDERWWRPDRDAREELARAAVKGRQEERVGDPYTTGRFGATWLDKLQAWATSDEDGPLDFQGVELPPRVAMLLGRAFSDVAGLIGERVRVVQQDGIARGNLRAVHRDATGAPYAIVVDDGGGEPWVTFPWPQIMGIAPDHPQPPAPGPDPWAVDNEPPF